MAQFDAQVPYLKQILGFIGITDVSVIYADSLRGPKKRARALWTGRSPRPRNWPPNKARKTHIWVFSRAINR
jgi:hypothetical protein